MQVLVNLLSNSVKYTSEVQGMISVEVNLTEGRHGDKYLVFDILDTGSGIKETKIDDMFQLFSGNISCTRTTGFGLGLTASKMISELLGGDLSLK